MRVMTSISEARAAITTNPHLLPAEREVLLGLDDTDLSTVARAIPLIVEEVGKLPDGLQSTLDDLARAASTGFIRTGLYPVQDIADPIRYGLSDHDPAYPRAGDDTESWAWAMAAGELLY